MCACMGRVGVSCWVVLGCAGVVRVAVLGVERELWVGEVGGWVPDLCGWGERVRFGGEGASVGCCYVAMPCNAVGLVVSSLL